MFLNLNEISTALLKNSYSLSCRAHLRLFLDELDDLKSSTHGSSVLLCHCWECHLTHENLSDANPLQRSKWIEDKKWRRIIIEIWDLHKLKCFADALKHEQHLWCFWFAQLNRFSMQSRLNKRWKRRSVAMKTNSKLSRQNIKTWNST